MKKTITHATVKYECGHEVTVQVLKGNAFDIPDICESCRAAREPTTRGEG